MGASPTRISKISDWWVQFILKARDISQITHGLVKRASSAYTRQPN